MAREVVARAYYGGAWVTWQDAARDMAMQLIAAGVGPDLTGVTIERPAKTGDHTRLIAYREAV